MVLPVLGEIAGAMMLLPAISATISFGGAATKPCFIPTPLRQFGMFSEARSVVVAPRVMGIPGVAHLPAHIEWSEGVGVLGLTAAAYCCAIAQKTES